MKRGFTILELLVASLLLSMLVTMLTMIFNQSSTAWNTGVASVKDLESVRTQLGGYHDAFDDALPGVGQQSGYRDILDNGREIRYRTVSLFRNWNGSGRLQANNASANCPGRAFDEIQWRNGTESLQSYRSRMQEAMKGELVSLSGGSGSMGQNQGVNVSRGAGDIVVGIRSSGPDRKMNTSDDLNTFPEDVN